MNPQNEFHLSLSLRPFGTRWEDLDTDFSAPRPFVVTDVLNRCTTSDLDVEDLWNLTAGTRISALLALSSLGGKREFDTDFICRQCGLAVEVTLGIEELLRLSPSESCVVISSEGGTARYRLPTGQDQREWLQYAGENEEQMRSRILASLCVEGKAKPESVDAALDAADPLIRGGVTAVCPDCGCPHEMNVDLAGAALARLEGQQRSLLEGVHLLATHYHWSEAEIFALPAWRREHYLGLLRWGQ